MFVLLERFDKLVPLLAEESFCRFQVKKNPTSFVDDGRSRQQC